MTEGFEKNIERKEENAAKQQFLFFLNVFNSIMTKNSLCLNSSANASNLDLLTIFYHLEEFKSCWKRRNYWSCAISLFPTILLGKSCEIMIVLSESKRGLFKYIY